MNALPRQSAYTLAGRRLVRPRTLAMLTGTGLPVGYVIAKHVGWEKSPDSKRRMLIHQLSFWSAAALAVVALHRIKRWRVGAIQKTLASLGATAPAALAFEGGAKLAALLVPYRPKAEFPKPTRYRPSFLQNAPQVPSLW